MENSQSLLRNQEFRRFLVARSIADIGAYGFRAALVWAMTVNATSGVTLGYVLMALSLPQAIFSLIGGAVADRYGRKLIIILCDLASFVAVFALWGLEWTGAMGGVHLLALVFLIGLCSAIFGPSVSTIMPSLVPEALLQRANSLRASAGQFIALTVPALTGFALMSASVGAVYLVAALCFLMSTLLFLPAQIPAPVARPTGKGFGGDLVEGIRATFSKKWLGAGVLTAVAGNFLIVAPQSALVPVLIQNAGLGPEVLGLYFSASPIGFLLGSYMSGRLKVQHESVAVFVSICALALTSAMYAAPLNAALVLCISIANGVSIGVFEVVWSTIMQKKVEPELLSRVYSVQASLSFTSRSISLAGVGFLMGQFNAQLVIACLAAACLGFAILITRLVCQHESPPPELAAAAEAPNG